MKSDLKVQLKAAGAKELMKKLQELESEKFKLVTKVKFNRGYPLQVQVGGGHGNIQRINKDIARVKTWLNVKLKAENR